MKKTKFNTHLAKTMFMLLFVLAAAFGAQAQVTNLDRAHILTEPVYIQKKILDNTPTLYSITDLINYPLAIEESRQRPGFQYITVNDFHNSSLVRKMDIIVYNPNLYYISADSTSIPPLRVLSPEEKKKTENQY
jgi:hypothetical protein